MVLQELTLSHIAFYSHMHLELKCEKPMHQLDIPRKLLYTASASKSLGVCEVRHANN